MLFSFRKKGVHMVRRKDNKGRVLEKGESQRKDGLYVYQYSDISGKRKSVYAKTLSDLRKKEKQVRRDLEDNINTTAAEITLNEQFEKYMSLKKQISDTTRQTYWDMWNSNVKENPLGKMKICNIKKSDILRFYNSLKARELKVSTIKGFANMISPCLELAVDDDVIRKNPCKGCLDGFSNDSIPKKSLTSEEQEVLLGFTRQSKVYSAHYPMIVFMIGTAVRCGEAIGLTWNDVDFKKLEISINHQLIYKKRNGVYCFYADSPKSAAGIRVIPMTRAVYEALKQQRERQMSKGWGTNVEIDGYSNFVFSTKNKRPIMPRAVDNTLQNIVNKYNQNTDKNQINLPHISAHD